MNFTVSCYDIQVEHTVKECNVAVWAWTLEMVGMVHSTSYIDGTFATKTKV